ncbi:MAG: MBL fold metallo-hydrolase [Lachnospiraceae bacterium]
MKIKKFLTGIISTNCYIAENEETKQAVIIDPAACSKKILEYIEEEGLTIEAILLTHGHFDHIMGIDGFLEHFDIPVYVHEADEPVMNDPRLNQSATYTKGYTFSGAQYLRDKQTLELAGYKFEVIHTPGHTWGGCCYYVESEKVLFSGDTLFQRSVGRSDFETSSTSDLIYSVREKLMKLPDDTLVYPGHMGETTIGYERANNPFI